MCVGGGGGGGENKSSTERNEKIQLFHFVTSCGKQEDVFIHLL